LVCYVCFVGFWCSVVYSVCGIVDWRCEFVVRFDLLVLFRLGAVGWVIILVVLVFACFRLLVIVLRSYFTFGFSFALVCFGVFYLVVAMFA